MNTRKWYYLIILIILGVTTVRGSIVSEGMILYFNIVCNTFFPNAVHHLLNNISFSGYQSIVWTNYHCETNQRLLTTIKTRTHCPLYIIKITSNFNHRIIIGRKLLICFVLSSLEREMIIHSSMLILNSKKGEWWKQEVNICITYVN